MKCRFEKLSRHYNVLKHSTASERSFFLKYKSQTCSSNHLDKATFLICYQRLRLYIQTKTEARTFSAHDFKCHFQFFKDFLSNIKRFIFQKNKTTLCDSIKTSHEQQNRSQAEKPDHTLSLREALRSKNAGLIWTLFC